MGMSVSAGFGFGIILDDDEEDPGLTMKDGSPIEFDAEDDEEECLYFMLDKLLGDDKRFSIEYAGYLEYSIFLLIHEESLSAMKDQYSVISPLNLSNISEIEERAKKDFLQFLDKHGWKSKEEPKWLVWGNYG